MNLDLHLANLDLHLAGHSLGHFYRFDMRGHRDMRCSGCLREMSPSEHIAHGKSRVARDAANASRRAWQATTQAVVADLMACAEGK